jgi:hypothetical protein
VFVRISLDGGVLVFRGVLLVLGGHADILRRPDEAANRITMFPQCHNDNDGDRHHQHETRGGVVTMDRRFLPGHSPLYDVARITTKEMFFTKGYGLVFRRKSFDDNEFRGGQDVLYAFIG